MVPEARLRGEPKGEWCIGAGWGVGNVMVGSGVYIYEILLYP